MPEAVHKGSGTQRGNTPGSDLNPYVAEPTASGTRTSNGSVISPTPYTHKPGTHTPSTDIDDILNAMARPVSIHNTAVYACLMHCSCGMTASENFDGDGRLEASCCRVAPDKLLGSSLVERFISTSVSDTEYCL